jgi:membrane-associated phospholipid phosphatase
VSFDAKIKWSVIAGVSLVAAGLVAWLDLRLPWTDLGGLALLALPVAAAVGHFHRQRRRRVVLSLSPLLQFLLFSCSYTVLMCIAAMTGRPLIDAHLMEVDQWFRVSVPGIAAWTQQYPLLDGLLTLAYHLLVPQTIFVLLMLGRWGDRRPSEQFLLRLMIAALLLLPIFITWPAVGPYYGYGVEPTAVQQEFLDDFLSLRSGEARTVTVFHPKGLITFPSFHTTWALLLTAACVHRRWLFAAVVPVNAALIAATMTLGWHYWADVLAGAVLAAVAIAVSDPGRIRGCRESAGSTTFAEGNGED